MVEWVHERIGEETLETASSGLRTKFAETRNKVVAIKGKWGQGRF